MIKEYNKMKEEIKNSKSRMKYAIQTQWKPIVSVARKILQTNDPVTKSSYHDTYAFQSESTLYSCVNVKELLSQSRRKI